MNIDGRVGQAHHASGGHRDHVSLLDITPFQPLQSLPVTTHSPNSPSWPTMIPSWSAPIPLAPLAEQQQLAALLASAWSTANHALDAACALAGRRTLRDQRQGHGFTMQAAATRLGVTVTRLHKRVAAPL